MASRGVQTRSSASVYPLHIGIRGSQIPDLHVALRVDNYPHIATAYGAEAAEAVQVAIQQRLGALLKTAGIAVSVEPGTFGLFVWDADSLLRKAGADPSGDDLLAMLLAENGPIAVPGEAEPVCAVLSGAWVECDEGCGTLDFDARSMRAAMTALEERRVVGPVLATDEWRRQYRHDMAIAAELFEARAHNRLQLAWQPVRHSAESGNILYYECLLRIIGGNGELLAPGRYILALERLGLIRSLDRHCVLNVIDELRASPDLRLGVNVSAQSAVQDVWWLGVFEMLAAARDLAGRLVIEITESAAFSSIAQSSQFIASLQAVGCTVVLDDFGMGYSSIAQLIALKPNMVKIDAFFVRRARRSRDGRKCLEHLIGFASAIAQEVVVEGIEDEEQSAIAGAAGALWQQGYHQGRPAITRPSRFGRIAEADGDAPEMLFNRPGDTVVLPARFNPRGLLLGISISLVLWAGLVSAGIHIWRMIS